MIFLVNEAAVLEVVDSTCPEGETSVLDSAVVSTTVCVVVSFGFTAVGSGEVTSGVLAGVTVVGYGTDNSKKTIRC